MGSPRPVKVQIERKEKERLNLLPFLLKAVSRIIRLTMAEDRTDNGHRRLITRFTMLKISLLNLPVDCNYMAYSRASMPAVN